MEKVAVDRRQPALDGMRALAVAFVIAYHGGIPGLRVAGFYGVDVFFVLSGFLITRLLLIEHAESGRIRLAMFWGRRARRLLPGLLVMLAAVEAYVAWIAPPGRYPGFRGDALSVVAYGSNWHFIQASSNYFDATGIPSLLTHTWSLAIEEQFYVVWPLLLWGAVWLAGRIRRNPASLVLALSTAGALASTGWMATLFRTGVNPSRLYYGTDTHAQSILIGCALAALTVVIPIRSPGRLATPAALVALGALGWAACSLGSSNSTTYEGGFLLVALLTAVLLAVLVAAPSSIAARALSLAPLAYIGRISYGMYLWYFPLFAVIDRADTGLAGAGLFTVRCAADVLIAAISFHVIEQPIRTWKPRFRHALPAGLGTLVTGATAALVAAALILAGTPTVPSVASPSASAVLPTRTGAQGGARILVFGDSTAATLGNDLSVSRDAQQHRIAVDVVGMFGCGLLTSAAISLHGQSSTPAPACRAGSPPRDKWPAVLRTAISTFRPAVVLVVTGRWEVESRQATPGGPWLDITEPGDAAYVRAQLQMAASIVVQSGARLALATAPCYASGEQPNGDPWPEDSPHRLTAYNSLVRQASAHEVAAHPGSAVVVDLDSIVCPAGKFHTEVNGVVVRAPDGIHFPAWDWKRANTPAPDTLSEAERFGTWIEPKILLQIASVPR